MVRKFCLLVIFPLAVMGCSSNTMLTVHSEPAGAELTTVGTGVPLGRAPAAAPDLEQDIEYAKGMRLSDIEWHRREQQRRTPVLSSTNTQQTEFAITILEVLNRPNRCQNDGVDGFPTGSYTPAASISSVRATVTPAFRDQYSDA